MKSGTPKSERIPSLDGLRAISIAFVIAFHIQILPPSFGILGNLGVRVFFVISGYLITGLLLKEWASTGRISLKHFYIRRALRIFPAFYAYVAIVAVFAGLGFVTLERYDILRACTYTINLFPGSTQAPDVRHIWSLAIEEQFYLMWPALLVFAGRRRALLVAAAFVAIAPLLRVVYWLFLPSMHDFIDRHFETVFDALAVGCVLAGIQRWLAGRKTYNGFLCSRWFYILPIGIVPFAVLTSPRPRIYYGIAITVLNLLIAVCIDRFVRYPQGLFGRFLNSKPLIFIGLLSYSIYLWQQPFLDLEAGSTFPGLALRLACAAAASVASYFLIEQPTLKLRRYLSRPVPVSFATQR